MAAFETLLNRFCTRYVAVEASLALASLDRRSDPPLEKAWRCWAEAQAALRRGDPRLGLAWLDSGRRLAGALGDVILAAEYAHAEANCWLALDEPREAAHGAREAWRLWASLAAKPPKETATPSARVLLKVLSEPDAAPRLSDEDLFKAWLSDRFALSFLSAAQQVMGVYGDYKQLEQAKEVAGAFLAWVDRFLGTGPARAWSGLPAARSLLKLGDVHDRCGDSEGALAVFEDALKRLEGLPNLDEIDVLRGQLRFNAANQLAKLGRREEALNAFEAANSILARFGERETVLRGRYAICVSRFKLGERAEAEDELSALAVDYERVVAEAQAGPQLATARQGLDRVYRLWLRLVAERFEPCNAREVAFLLHLVFALKEEEGKFAGLWRQAQNRPEAVLVTEVTVMLDRVRRRDGLGVLIVEQVTDALLFVSVRPGSAPWTDRVAVQVVDDAHRIEAVEDLLERHRDAMARLNSRAIPIRSTPDERFVAACGAAWALLSDTIREHIAAAQTLMVCLGSEIDRFPVELAHDGRDYLGLSKDVLRAPSLRDLNDLLGDNRTNARRTGAAIVLRADDDLPKADSEASIVEEGLRALEIEPRVLRAPSVTRLLDELGAGVDALHYVGHGLADAIGEELPLGPGERLIAMQLEALHPAPAPVTVLSACLAGRGRQLRTGHEQGFATRLLRRGSPAVIAAMHPVPDALAIEFSELLYQLMRETTLSSALRSTRRALAEDVCHPAAAFVMYGRPDVRMADPHANPATAWPAAALRYLATGAETHLRAAQTLLKQDIRLAPACRGSVARELARLARGDSAHFRRTSLRAIDGLEEFPEANMASQLIRVFGRIRHGSAADPEEREKRIETGITQALTASRILADPYVLIAAAVEMCARTLWHLSGLRTTALQAGRRLSWISAEGAALDRARAEIPVED
jgi:tetratricopeptide (TPR) repeat protein